MLDERDVRRLAQASHERHREGISPDSPASGRDFADLDAAHREANLDHVRFLPALATALGYDIVEAKAGPRGIDRLGDQEVEAGARIEHLRWERLTRRQGRMDHPDLRSWDELDEPTRERDRARVRDLPALLAEVDKILVRTPESDGPGGPPASSAT